MHAIYTVWTDRKKEGNSDIKELESLRETWQL